MGSTIFSDLKYDDEATSITSEVEEAASRYVCSEASCAMFEEEISIKPDALSIDIA